MIVRLLLLAVLATPLNAQGFAGLGTDADGFALPDRDHSYVFPDDHGAHPDFRIEWWYLTANLRGEDQEAYGIQWTLFRSALAPGDAAGWQSPQLWMGHAALTTADKHFVSERIARGGVGAAGVRADPFEAWLDDWSMLSLASAEGDALDRLQLRANGDGFAYDLRLDASGPLVFHGDRGYSVKSAKGQASHYYSQPFYTVAGTLDVNGESIEVNGNAWLDREWSSQPLAEDQTGWDWFSLSFESGDKLMAFRLRDTGDGFQSGTWISPDGTTTKIEDTDVRVTPLETSKVNDRTIPTKWQLELPKRGLSVEISALNPKSWMTTSVTYWEGPVRVTGTHIGVGYLEMTGY